MKYRQLNAEERSVLAALRSVGLNHAQIARELGRHRSTVGRELKRNAAPYDGRYRSERAHQRAHARRYRSRRNSQFGREEWSRVEELLGKKWSPEQVSGHLARSAEMAISQESIYYSGYLTDDNLEGILRGSLYHPFSSRVNTGMCGGI